MSKLFNLKNWLSVPATATHLSNVMGESVTEDDVMDLLIDGRLMASLMANSICACPLVGMSDIEAASHVGSKWKLPDGSHIGPTGDSVVLQCRKPIDLPPNYDSATLLAAAKGQGYKTGSIQVPPGVVIQTPGTDEYYCVLGGRKIPETHGQIVVRTESLREFERQMTALRNTEAMANATPLVMPGAVVAAPEQNIVPPEPVLADKAGPESLTTNQIANCFAEFRGWGVKRWKTELGSPDKWLKACQQLKGTQGRGGYESMWWPVQIAVALVNQDPKSARSVRARFKKQEPLKPWLDVLEINIPDNSDN